MPNETIELYQALKERVLGLGDNIEVRPRKKYVGFVAGTNFVDVHTQRMQLKLWINLPKGELDDPKKVARDVSEVGHWGNGDYQVLVGSSEGLDYLMTLIKQSFTKHSLIQFGFIAFFLVVSLSKFWKICRCIFTEALVVFHRRQCH